MKSFAFDYILCVKVYSYLHYSYTMIMQKTASCKCLFFNLVLSFRSWSTSGDFDSVRDTLYAM